MFRLDAAEVTDLNRSQIVTGSQKHRVGFLADVGEGKIKNRNIRSRNK